MTEYDKWQAETYARFHMIHGGSEIAEENARSQVLIREFVHFWPEARGLWELSLKPPSLSLTD